ncbi:MAG: DUF4279 domain-containing protein [Gemmatimonadaceae bacterium]|nr:DUF4279 domain-containing protein [Gemmatimonadaceae bacterium]
MNSDLQVSIVVTSLRLDPTEIEQRLGRTPSRTWRLGDSIASTITHRKHHGWVLTATNGPGAPLDEQVQSLLDQIDEPAMRALKLEGEVEIEFACVARIADETPVLCVSREILDRVVRVGAGIDIDIVPL